MRKFPSGAFNKEKLVFLCAFSLLLLSLYYLWKSAPQKLEPEAPTTSLRGPAPLDADPTETRVAEVRHYFAGTRENPFQPVEFERPHPPGTPGGDPRRGPVVIVEPPPRQPDDGETGKPRQTFEPSGPVRLSFSGVVTANNMTVGLLKVTDGRTVTVREGETIPATRQTVAKIAKQTIVVADSDARTYVARDRSFDAPRSDR